MKSHVKKRLIGAATILTLAMTLAPAGAQNAPANQQTTQAQQQGSILRGNFRGLRFVAYEPGRAPANAQAADQLHVSAHSQGKLLGAKWDGRNIILSYRANADLRTVYRYHADQLRGQGFERQGDEPQINADARDLAVKFERSNDVIELKVNRDDNNAYRVLLDLEAVQVGSQEAAAGANQARQPVQPTTPNQAARDPNQPLLERRGPDGIAYLVYPVPIEVVNDARSIRISAPDNATVTNARSEDEDIILDLRSSRSLADVGKFYDDQLTKQGFRRTETGDNNDEAWNATYQRGQNLVKVDVDRTSANTFRVLYNFEGARDDNRVNPPGATGTTGTARGTTGTTGATATQPRQNYQEAVRAQMGNNVLVTVLPVGYDPPTSNTSNRQFALVPPKNATEATANIDGNQVLIGYLAPGTLQEQYSWFDGQFKTLGFEAVNPPATSTDTGDAAQSERKVTYRRGDGTVAMTVQRWSTGDRPGWRVLANFDDYVKNLK